MPSGFQVNDGQADRVYVGIPGHAQAFDTEGVAIERMRQKQAEDALAQQAQQANADRVLRSGQGDQERALQLQLGMAPINLKRDVFNSVSPLLTGLLGGAGGPGGPNPLVGGQSPAAPDITRGPIWNDQQIKEQVNAGQSANQAAADTQNRTQATKLAGQGFGTRSPLLAALQGATGMQTAAANADVARKTQWDAAQGNADSTYRGDQLATQQWDLAQKQDIARRQAAANYTTSLASMLASLA